MSLGSSQAQQGTGLQQQQDILNQLLQQAGPRGATYAGRVVQQPTSVAELMAQRPTDSPDAEGLGGLGVMGAGAGIARQVKSVPGEITNEILPSQSIKGYHVVDTHTGGLVKKYTAEQGAAASRMVDKLDSQYGGYRYARKPIYKD